MSKASDYEFCTFRDENDTVAVLMGPISDPEFGGHLSDQVRPFWPAGIVMDEVEESTFLVEELTEQEVQNELKNAGFVYSEDWQTELNAELGI